MANRSHLYSIDTIPTKDGPPKPCRGLTEFNWGIPLVHELLVSSSPRVCTSAIWPEHEIGIVGDQDGAFQLLFDFLRTIVESGAVKDKADFDRAAAETRTFLSEPKRRGTYVLLEAGEIFDAMGDELAPAAKRLATVSIPATRERVLAAIGGGEKAWLEELRGNWKERLGIEWWSDVLYYSFPE